MNTLVRRTLHGALGGLIGGACMTAMRMLAHRAKLIDQMVPQAVEAWAKHRLPIATPTLPSERAVHHVADQFLHLGYAAGLGAVYGLGFGKGQASLARVVKYGLGVWFLGSFVLLPGLKVMRPEWRAKPVELAVNLTAHLLFAGTVALVTEEYETQSFVQPLHYPGSLLAKTG